MSNEHETIDNTLINMILEDIELEGENVKQVFPKVKLLTYTPEPLEVVNIAARRCYSDLDNDTLVSYVEGLENEELGKFINGVIKTGHTSTVEHAVFTFMIEGVSLVLLKQVTRARIASFSVQSERYVAMDDGFSYIMPVSIMELGDEAMAEYAAQMCTMHEWYKGWREKGIEPEDARYVIPQAAETKYVVTMNIRELLHFLSLRCCERTQWELRHAAKDMLWELQNVLPEIFGKVGPSCVMKGKCPEGKRSCGRADDVKKEFAALFEMNKILRDAG